MHPYRLHILKVADWIRGEGAGSGFTFISQLWAGGVFLAGILAGTDGVLTGQLRIWALGLIAAGMLSFSRKTRVLGGLLCGLCGAGFDRGGGGFIAGGLTISLATWLGRPGLGRRGLQLSLLSMAVAGVVAFLGGGWKESSLALGLSCGFWRARVPVFWLLCISAVPLWLGGIFPLDIFCVPAMLAAWMGREERDRLRAAAGTLPGRTRRAWAFLSRPMGDWRTRLSVGAMGWAMYQNWLIMTSKNTMLAYASGLGPPCITVLYLLGTLSIFLGCRPGLMLVLSGAGLWHLLESWFDTHPQLNFTGEEYLVWFVFPLGIFACCVLGRRMADAEFGNLTGMLSRVMLFGSLGFAVLAKLNTDFFAAQTSCMALANDIPLWWKVPPGTGTISAPVLVAAEGAPLLLSFVSGSAAVLSVLGFAQGLAAIGPLGINACVIALTLGLLRHSDGEILLRHRRKILIAGALFVLFGLPASQVLYIGTRPWYQFAFFHTVCVLIGCGAVTIFCSRCRGAFDAARVGGVRGAVLCWSQGWRENLAGLAGGGRVVFLCVTAALLMLNGLCPYLGVKFRCSFSMLANLRVDHDRWNHFFMPKWMLLTKHDPYVRVIKELEGHFRSPRLSKRKILAVGNMYSPEYFARATFERGVDGQRTHLLVRWRGAEGVLDSDRAGDFQAFVNGLPRRADWGNQGLQDVLTMGDVPQPCTH